MHIMLPRINLRMKVIVFQRRAFSVKELPWCSPKSSITKKNAWAQIPTSKECASCDNLARIPNFKIGLIAAMNQDGIIGMNGSLPWSLPTERKHFVSCTRNKTVIVGRKTYMEENDLSHICHAKNIIIVSKTMQKEQIKNIPIIRQASLSQHLSKSLDEAISIAKNLDRSDSSDSSNDIKCWIIGGERLYEEGLRNNHTVELRLTMVHGQFPFNVRDQSIAFFPPKYRYDHIFREDKHMENKVFNEGDDFEMTFRVFKRKGWMD